MRTHFVLLVLALSACAGAAREPAPSPRVVQVTAPKTEPDDGARAAPAAASCTPKPRTPKPIKPVASVPPSPDDPTRGQFGLAQAIEGLHGSWPLRAKIVTSLGTLECELWDDVAPLSVATFVGLARGTRAWKRSGVWVREPAYDGSSFHRLEPGFVIQGGDYTGTGRGEPGFVIPDELDDSIHADRRGLLYFANRGPNTNGMQFFILDGPAPHLDGRYSAFGECGPDELISRIANVKQQGQTSVSIEHVVVAFENPCPGP